VPPKFSVFVAQKILVSAGELSTYVLVRPAFFMVKHRSLLVKIAMRSMRFLLLDPSPPKKPIPEISEPHGYGRAVKPWKSGGLGRCCSTSQVARLYLGFHKWGIPNSWMVYGKPHAYGWQREK